MASCIHCTYLYSVILHYPVFAQRMLKLPHNCTHFTCYQSNAQNSPSQLQQYVNHELPDVPVGFIKGRGTRDQTANIHWIIKKAGSVQFSSVTQLCPTLCDPMDCSTPDLPVHHQLPEFTQAHVH